MSAAGRLWRRAPAWRVSIVCAVALTGLAAMFPPTLPALHAPWSARLADGGRARFHPVPVPPDGDDSILSMPPPGPPRTGIIALAGRKLPLPSGSWQTLAFVWSPGSPHTVLMDRINNRHLTGMVLVTATGLFGGAASPVNLPPQCADPARLAGHITPALPGQSPLAHQCWAIVPLDMKALASGDANPLIQRGMQRLGAMQVDVPDRMLAVQFVRSTDQGWQTTIVLLPDQGGPITATSAWAGRYEAVLHKGFDGTLQPADLTAAAVQTPS